MNKKKIKTKTLTPKNMFSSSSWQWEVSTSFEGRQALAASLELSHSALSLFTLWHAISISPATGYMLVCFCCHFRFGEQDLGVGPFNRCPAAQNGTKRCQQLKLNVAHHSKLAKLVTRA